MMSNLQKKILLLVLFSYILFNHVKKDEYHIMFGLAISTGVFSHLYLKNDIYEGADNIQFTEEEETERREAQLQAEADAREDDDVSSTTAEASETEPDSDSNTDTSEGENDSAPLPANTPFVSAEYARLRDEARKEESDNLDITGDKTDEKPPVLTEFDSPEGTGPTDPDSTSDETMFKEKEKVKLTVVEDRFRMGPYDGLCVSSDKMMENELVSNDELVTYFGVQVPQEIVTSQDVLRGPTVDGSDDAPQKLSLFANNKTSLNCCGESPFMTSMGCICLTENQRNFIRSRGLNRGEIDL